MTTTVQASDLVGRRRFSTMKLERSVLASGLALLSRASIVDDTTDHGVVPREAP